MAFEFMADRRAEQITLLVAALSCCPEYFREVRCSDVEMGSQGGSYREGSLWVGLFRYSATATATSTSTSTSSLLTTTSQIFKTFSFLGSRDLVIARMGHSE